MCGGRFLARRVSLGGLTRTFLRQNGCALVTTPPPTRQFRDLGLPAHLLAAVERLGYTEPTPIQAAAIPRL